ncbi:hypothetical protein [Mycobacterium sp.]|uniref:PPW family C-terminal domain-containing PPE protein n=1 Tax=Mycobacterium sp. TaxID=1785 RepID=UPI0025DF8F80|nr:hypothetical protein [Mycobacterium sp.]
MNVDVDPDWGRPPGEQPAAPAVASDQAAGPLGYAGARRRNSLAEAAGLITLAGDEFGDGPAAPMLPGSR